MPYLSQNYRYQPKSKIKSLAESAVFVGFSGIAILVTLFVIGFISSQTTTNQIAVQDETAVSRSK